MMVNLQEENSIVETNRQRPNTLRFLFYGINKESVEQMCFTLEFYLKRRLLRLLFSEIQ